MKRDSDQLVSQWLEGISRTAFEKYQEIIKTFVRRRHGIYALYRHGKLYYVGLASNLRSRLRSHLDDRHGGNWDSFGVYLTVQDSHLRQLESLVLRIASPKGNRQKGNFGRAINLRREFRRAIRAYQHREMEDVFAITRAVHEKAEEVRGGAIRTKLAQYVRQRMKIRMTFHGKEYRAHVRSDGMIRFRRKLYKSPSAAASSVSKGAIDGWFAWRYERAPGDWMPLDTLRK